GPGRRHGVRRLDGHRFAAGQPGCEFRQLRPELRAGAQRPVRVERHARDRHRPGQHHRPTRGPSAEPGRLSAFAQGPPCLTQLGNDVSALLDQELTHKGDHPSITATLNAQIKARIAPYFAAGLPGSIAVFWLDPVSLDVRSPQGQRAAYSLQNNQVSNNLERTYVNVSGNVEVVVMANVPGTFQLGVADVPATARGGAVVLGDTTAAVLSFTDAVRAGESTFVVQVPGAAGTTWTSPSDTPPATGAQPPAPAAAGTAVVASASPAATAPTPAVGQPASPGLATQAAT